MMPSYYSNVLVCSISYPHTNLRGVRFLVRAWLLKMKYVSHPSLEKWSSSTNAPAGGIRLLIKTPQAVESSWVKDGIPSSSSYLTQLYTHPVPGLNTAANKQFFRLTSTNHYKQPAGHLPHLLCLTYII